VQTGRCDRIAQRLQRHAAIAQRQLHLFFIKRIGLSEPLPSPTVGKYWFAPFCSISANLSVDFAGAIKSD
jgi:hypothetical protein